MKIIKPGRKQRGWSKECICTGIGNGKGGCGAVLLVEQGDMYHTYKHCRDETETFNTFKCPSCGVETDIDDIPSNISRTLPSSQTYFKHQPLTNEISKASNQLSKVLHSYTLDILS